jgi:hypothetical protein
MVGANSIANPNKNPIASPKTKNFDSRESETRSIVEWVSD